MKPSRTLTIAIAFLLFAVCTAPCQAASAESTFKPIFMDAIYGGLTGSLIGAAALAFTHKPGRHLDYIGYGAAAGVVVGAAYGIGKAVVELDNGRVRFSMPTIIPDFPEANSRSKNPVVITAELVRGKF